jgi:hypothetical protein
VPLGNGSRDGSHSLQDINADCSAVCELDLEPVRAKERCSEQWALPQRQDSHARLCSLLDDRAHEDGGANVGTIGEVGVEVRQVRQSERADGGCGQRKRTFETGIEDALNPNVWLAREAKGHTDTRLQSNDLTARHGVILMRVPPTAYTAL